jgi:hypothetical protein
MSSYLGSTVALALAACALTGGAARAAEVQVQTVISCEGDVACEKYNAGTPHNAFGFFAAPGEANDVTITVTSTRTLSIHDAGATLTAGRQCTVIGEHDATCDVGERPYERFSIGLGDGADRLRVDGQLQDQALIGGAAGDDDLSGGGEGDTLLGGLGSDRLTGGGGDDVLRGGDANPGESIEPDALDGGLGSDLVTYSDRKEAVTVDLGSTAAVQGAQGEGDTLTSIENVWSGEGDDTLTGSDADGSLRGGMGDDVLEGRGGDEVLIGDGGRDTFRGGGGVDRIDANDRLGEPVSCGAGIDLVAAERFDDYYGTDLNWLGADAGDVLAGDCEGTALNGDTRAVPFGVDPRARRRGPIVTVANPCRRKGAGRRCSGQLSATVAGRRKPATIRFKRRGRRVGVRVGTGTPVRLRLRLNLRGQSYTTRFSVSLPSR